MDMSPRVRRWLLVAAGGAHLGVTARMLPFERAMRAAASRGIVALEVAGNAERAQQLLDAWGPTGRGAARRSLRWDYGYLTSYAVFLAAACAGAARRLGRRGWPAAATVGPTVAWAPVLAGGCDAVENAALLAVLRRGPHPPLPALARTAALAKFAVLGPALAYLVLAALLPRRCGGADDGGSAVVAGRQASRRDRMRP